LRVRRRNVRRSSPGLARGTLTRPLAAGPPGIRSDSLAAWAPYRYASCDPINRKDANGYWDIVDASDVHKTRNKFNDCPDSRPDPNGGSCGGSSSGGGSGGG